jgi:hypothetical protein
VAGRCADFGDHPAASLWGSSVTLGSLGTSTSFLQDDVTAGRPAVLGVASVAPCWAASRVDTYPQRLRGLQLPSSDCRDPQAASPHRHASHVSWRLGKTLTRYPKLPKLPLNCTWHRPFGALMCAQVSIMPALAAEIELSREVMELMSKISLRFSGANSLEFSYVEPVAALKVKEGRILLVLDRHHAW